MNVRITGIKIKNITSYIEEQSIDLSKFKNVNFVVLNGRVNDNNTNGSGKSSIILSIMTSLGLLSNYKSLKSIHSSEDSKIELEISDDKHLIKIKRVFNKTKSSLDVFSNNEEDLLFLRIKDNEQFIKDKLLIDENFTLTHIFTPSNESIYDLSSSQLFELLERLFKIDEMDKINTYTKNRLKDLKNKIELISNKITMNKSLIDDFKKQIDEFKQKKQLNNIDKKLQDLNVKINNIVSLIKESITSLKYVNFVNVKMEDLLNNPEMIVNLLSEIKNILNTLDKEISSIQKEINNLSSDEKHYKQLISEYSKLKSLNVCPMCKQLITNETKINYDNFIVEYTNNLNDIKSKSITLNNKINDLKNDYKTLLNLQNNFNSLLLTLGEIQNLVNSKEQTDSLINSEINKYEKKILELEKENEQLNKNILEIQNEINILEFLYNVTKQKSEVRQKYLFNFFSQLKYVSTEFSNMIFDSGEMFDVEFDIEKNQIIFGIRRGEVLIPYKFLSNGEKKKTSIVLIFTILKIMNITNSESLLRVLIFDDFFNGLDNNNIYKILNLMNEFSNKYNYQIIISNNNIDIIDFPCVVVDIVKINNTSYIESVTYKEFV